MNAKGSALIASHDEGDSRQSIDRGRAIRSVLILTLAIILLLGGGVFWGWNNRSRPGSISGHWILDDLRTERDDASLVTFHPSGVFEGDPVFASRWRFTDGQIYIRSWRRDGGSLISKWFGKTTVYSWFANSDEFPLVVNGMRMVPS